MQAAILLLVAQVLLGCSDSTLSHSAAADDLPQATVEDSLLPFLDSRKLYLKSDAALIVDGQSGRVLYEKHSRLRQPIASLTKLMTAMVVLDAGLPGEELITINPSDRDRLRGSGSKLNFGTQLTRRDLLKIALAGSENRAAAALGRTYPGGTEALVTAMNTKAGVLGMTETVFRDPAGLNSGNLSTAADLVTLARAADGYPLIRAVTTLGTDSVTDHRKGREIRYINTNRLVRNGKWNIGLSKTGYIAESGHCLVMRAELADRPVIVVLLNSWGELTKYGDANRVRNWLDSAGRKAGMAGRSADRFNGAITFNR